MPDVEAEGYGRVWVRLLVLLLAAFGVFGLWSGCNAVLLADLSRALGLSPGPLGVALFAGAASSIAAMASLGWAADRLSRKTFLVGVLCLFGVGIEQAIGVIATLFFVSGFIWALILYPRAGRGTRAVVVGPGDSPLPGDLLRAARGLGARVDRLHGPDVRVRLLGRARPRHPLERAAQGWGGRALLPGRGVAGPVGRVVRSCVRSAGRARLAPPGRRLRGLFPRHPPHGAGRDPLLPGGRQGGLRKPGGRAGSARREESHGRGGAREGHLPAWRDRPPEGRKDFDVSDVRADLLYTSRYSYLTPDPGGGSLLVAETDREVVDTERLPTEGPIRKGKTAEHRVSLRLPTDAPPTGEGKITGVIWAIGVVLEVPGGPDVSAKAPTTVLSTRDTYGERSGREQEPAPLRNVEIKLLPTNRGLRPGERLEGRLMVTPCEAFGAREVKVESVRRELMLRDDGNHHETVEAREAMAGRARFHPRNSQGYAFGVVVPRNLSCPSSETARTYVGWFLRGVIDRGPRPDHAVEQELNVFAGPRGGQSP